MSNQIQYDFWPNLPVVIDYSYISSYNLTQGWLQAVCTWSTWAVVFTEHTEHIQHGLTMVTGDGQTQMGHASEQNTPMKAWHEDAHRSPDRKESCSIWSESDQCLCGWFSGQCRPLLLKGQEGDRCTWYAAASPVRWHAGMISQRCWAAGCVYT